MNLIYKNDYGAIYSLEGAPNPNCSHQLIIGSIGIYMSLNDLSYLLDIVEACHYPCHCENCQGTFPDKIFFPNGNSEMCLHIDPFILADLEDLIKQTQFELNITQTLKGFKIRRHHF